MKYKVKCPSKSCGYRFESKHMYVKNCPRCHYHAKPISKNQKRILVLLRDSLNIMIAEN